MRGTPNVFNDYSAGVDKNLNSYSFDSNFARDLLNVQRGASGKVVKRNGFTSLATPTLPLTSLWTYERGTDKYIMAIGDDGGSTDIYSVTPAGTVTSRKGSLTVTAGRLWDGIQAPVNGSEGPVYFINGSDPALQWTGSGNAAVWTVSSGSLPNGKYLTYHDNCVFMAGVETNVTTKSTLYRSMIANPRLWDTPDGATTLLDPDDGEDITAIGSVGPYALGFKATKVFIITDTESLSYRRLTEGVGSVSHRSVTATDTGTFFLSSNRRIYVTDGSKTEPISTPVDPVLALIPDSSLPKVTGTYFDSSYLLSFSTSTTENDTILEYDTNNGSWWIHKIYIGSSSTTGVADWASIDPSANSRLYAAGANTTTKRLFQAFKPGTYADLTSQAFVSNISTSWNVFGNPHINKVITQIRWDSVGTETVSLTKRFESSGATETSVTLESDVPTEKAIYTPGSMRAISIKFENNDTSAWELLAHSIMTDQRTD